MDIPELARDLTYVNYCGRKMHRDRIYLPAHGPCIHDTSRDPSIQIINPTQLRFRKYMILFARILDTQQADIKTTMFTPALNLRFLLLAASLLTLLAGCASAPPAEEESIAEPEVQTVWPAPPEPAIIQYVSEITNFGIPEQKKKRFKDLLGGIEEKPEIRTFARPFSVTTDSQGRIFVGDAELHTVVVFDAEGTFQDEWGTSGMGQLATPLGLAADSNDNLYVCDTENQRVVVFAPDGRFLNTFGGSELLEVPVGIAINDTTDRVYVTDSKGNKIVVFNRRGDHMLTIEGSLGENKGRLYFPTSVDIDSLGNLWVVDSMNFRMVNLGPEGQYISHWGSLGTQLGQFTRPKAAGLDPDNNVYVTDVAFSNIQIFNAEGELLLFFGGAGNIPGYFSMPSDVHFDDQGQFYVADQRNRRIQIFRYLGEPVTGGAEQN
jgi:sugar lactone lactonase YvrE